MAAPQNEEEVELEDPVDKVLKELYYNPWHTRNIDWEGDVDVVLWSEHDEYVSSGFVMMEDY